MFFAFNMINRENTVTLLNGGGHIGLKTDICAYTFRVFLRINIISHHASINIHYLFAVDEFSIAQAFLHNAFAVMK